MITNYTNETTLIVLIGENRHNGRYVDELPAADIIRIEGAATSGGMSAALAGPPPYLRTNNDSRAPLSRKTRCHS